jgi:hypothetical protein
MDIDGQAVGKVLLAIGLLMAGVGLIYALGGRLPFGRLPGDIGGGSGNFSWSIPLGSSLLISVVLTIVLNLVLRH